MEEKKAHPMAENTDDLQVENLRLRLELERAKDTIYRLEDRLKYQDKVNSAEQYLLNAQIRELRFCLDNPREVGFLREGKTPFQEPPEEKKKGGYVEPPHFAPNTSYVNTETVQQEREKEARELKDALDEEHQYRDHVNRKSLDEDTELTIEDVPF